MSSLSIIERNQRLVQLCTGQPGRLPDTVRHRVESQWQGEMVQLYAMADLSPEFRLQEAWLVLGPSRLSLVRRNGAVESQADIPLAAIRRVREQTGLSCTQLAFCGDEGQPLAEVRYTHRQRRAMENIRFVVEQAIEGQVVPIDPADAVYADSVAGPIREAQMAVARHDLAIIWRLIAYLKPYWPSVLIGALTAVVITGVSLLPPYLTGYLIDHIVRPVEEGVSSPGAAMAQAWRVIGVIAGVYVLRGFCLWLRLRKLAFLGELVAHDLRRDLYAHLQRLSLRFFSRKHTGSIISRVSSDTDRLWDFIAFGVVEVFLSSVTLIGLSVVLLSLDWRLGLVLVLPVPLFIYAYFFYGRRIGRVFLKGWRKWSALTALLSDTIPGMRVVKAFNQERRESGRFNERNADALGTFNAAHGVWTGFWPMIMFGFHVVTLLVWCLALPRVTGLEGAALSTGTFVSFLLYMGMFMGPLETIGQITRILNRAVTSAHRVFEILDTEPQIVEQDAPVRLDPLQGRIEFENVSFSYDGVRRTLRNVNLTIEPGQMIGIVGPSGAGKSTLINLLARFYEVSDGSIRVDGVDVRRLDLDCYRRQLGMVMQDPYLFHGTIHENIAYGLPDAACEDVIAAARAANAHDFICRLPMGYETVVGERGHTLSGGERQRISIARAVLHNPRILILDEATSSVDTETERKIQDALDRLVSNRTVLAIAHRLSTLKRADRLIVLKDGALVEEGTHQELLDRPDGVYRHLHNLQSELHHEFAV